MYTRRRRARFTANIENAAGNVEKRVILAYDAQDVVDHFNRYGYIVLSVSKGDYRKQARDSQIQANGGFKIDREALDAAIAILGLKLPVRIRYNGRVGNTLGNYRFEGTYHNIMLKSYHSPEQASSTLWHELTHAMQAERSGGTLTTWSEYRNAQRRYSYYNKPMEREARQMSADMADLSLCTGA